MQPLLLDLFCGGGGCTKGYQQAGFYVVASDINPQPRCPAEEFYVANALEVLEALVETGEVTFESWRWGDDRILRLEEIAVIHASPPCQAYSTLRRVQKGKTYPDLIGPVRELLVASQTPYVIENVVGAPLIAPTVLCGSMFGLGAHGYKDRKWRQLRRHRLFESNVFIQRPECQHRGESLGVYGHGGAVSRYDIVDGRKVYHGRRGGYQGGNEEQAQAMDIDWMRQEELTQAIPPAYTKYVGEQLRSEMAWTEEFDSFSEAATA